MNITKSRIAVLAGTALTATAVYAVTQLTFTGPIELSNQVPDLGTVFKT